MSAVEDFLQDPVQFMRANHVTFKGGTPSPHGGAVHDFILLRLNEHARTRTNVFLGMSLGKADAGVYEIRARAALTANDPRLTQGEPFRAIWGGYVPGGKVECSLGSGGDAHIMLTPELTGCTVAFASQINGDARFSHYNLVAKGRTLRGADMVNVARRDYVGAGNVGVLTKEHYHSKSKASDGPLPRMTDEEWAKHRSRPAANVVGWRCNGKWTFWIQYTDMKGSVRQILGVKQLTPGVKIG